MNVHAGTNRLANEQSPYLLQHADNQVEWYPWCDAAFERAKQEDKPIFLSIGYSTCHWCHVMAHESFEDPEVAQLLNNGFVSIKVDREERPDIDHLYMAVCQAMTGSGGWPLTIIMTSEKQPFFTATYIPKTGRYGMTGMVDLLPWVRELWVNHREEIYQTAGKVVSFLNGTSGRGSGDREELDIKDIHTAYQLLARAYDSKHGGFGEAPKFPTPNNLLFLLRHWKRTGDTYALKMVGHTLQKMRAGGIYDHLGFGFHRYSTDRQWLVPHFEKMLYDQALLSLAYMELF